MEFYAAMKKNEMLSFAGKWMERNIHFCCLQRFDGEHRKYKISHLHKISIHIYIVVLGTKPRAHAIQMFYHELYPQS
jgi:hypothetical protein